MINTLSFFLGFFICWSLFAIYLFRAHQKRRVAIPPFKARPVLDRIIIKQDAAENKIGNYELSETAQKRPRQGLVVAVGPGAVFQGKTIPMMVKVGDKVQYADFIGANVTIEGEEYIVIKEGDLYFIL